MPSAPSSQPNRTPRRRGSERVGFTPPTLGTPRAGRVRAAAAPRLRGSAEIRRRAASPVSAAASVGPVPGRRDLKAAAGVAALVAAATAAELALRGTGGLDAASVALLVVAAAAWAWHPLAPV